MNLVEQTATTIPAPPIKQCMCGAIHTEVEWSCLRLVGLQDDGDGGWLEMRNCVCNSTIAIQVQQ